MLILTPVWSAQMYRTARRVSSTPVYNHIHIPTASASAPPVILSGWPHPSPLRDFRQSRLAILDLTAEWPRSYVLDPLWQYHNAPAWDGNAPRIEDLRAAVVWALEKHRQGFPVLFHCVFGVGRSSTALCAFLVHAGYCPDWRAAYAVVKASRPQVRLNASFQRVLEAFRTS